MFNQKAKLIWLLTSILICRNLSRHKLYQHKASQSIIKPLDCPLIYDFVTYMFTLCGQKFEDIITPTSGSSLNCCHVTVRTQLFRITLYTAALQFPFTGIKGPKHAPAWQCSWIKGKVHEGFTNAGEEGLKWPAQSLDLIPTEDLWEELECQLHPRSENLFTAITSVKTRFCIAIGSNMMMCILDILYIWI